MCVRGFSGSCAHSDGIRHQRDIRRLSWIDTGGVEREDVEFHLWENIKLSCFHIWMEKEKEDIRNPVLCTCVCLTLEQVL